MKQYKTSNFAFKQKSQDFIVEEQLPFAPKGKGDALFVFFEKRNLNTMDVINHLTSRLKISRMALGIAGLKDKKAITRQWISIYKSQLQKIGWAKTFMGVLAEKTRIIEATWHTKPIGLTTNISNLFHIRLRSLKKLSQQEKDDVTQSLRVLFTGGFVNVFGEQRFGIEKRNIAIGRAILDKDEIYQDKKEGLFKLQAYSSQLFNEYADMRVCMWLLPVDGDIVEIVDKNTGIFKDFAVYHEATNSVKVFKNQKGSGQFFRHPRSLGKEIPFDKETMKLTGPVLGYDLLLGRQSSPSSTMEQEFFERNNVTKKHGEVFQDLKLYGRRRALWVYPHGFKLKFQDDDILLRFSLPAGAYASVLVDEMIKLIS